MRQRFWQAEAHRLNTEGMDEAQAREALNA